jgi:hypothetical protein
MGGMAGRSSGWFVAVVLWSLAAALGCGGGVGSSAAQPLPVRSERPPRPATDRPPERWEVVVGRPTDRSAVLGIVAPATGEARLRIGPVGGALADVGVRALLAGAPTEWEVSGLSADTAFTWRLEPTTGGDRAEGRFRTQRAPGGRFRFGVQGDSHPEREGRSFDAALYERALANASEDELDLYVLLGDDFSIDPLLRRGQASAATVDAVYATQRSWLSALGRTTPLYLVNGNHEQAARYLLDGTAENPALWAGRARIRHFPLPAPDAFYSGDREEIPHLGLPRDYYAWTWGDAQFVVIDPYWHSPGPVDHDGRAAGDGKDPAARGGKGQRDGWATTLGDAQYRWLTDTLLRSRTRWIFVFAHHVQGTGRGGVEVAGRFEWGDHGPDFTARRPGWERTIHELFVEAGVTIFFQGHDHVYARQELDGVVYQTVPSPADPHFQAIQASAYHSGTVLPNGGHLRVTVDPAQVAVEYVRAFRPADPGRNGDVAHAYTIAPR